MDVTCQCGTTFQAKSSRRKYCSDRCRKRAQRGGKVVELPVRPEPDDVPRGRPVGGVERTTTDELEKAGRLETPIGQTCLVLARRLDRPGMDTGSAISSLAARLESLLATATKGAGKATAPQLLQDELAARRAQHGA